MAEWGDQQILSSNSNHKADKINKDNYFRAQKHVHNLRRVYTLKIAELDIRTGEPDGILAWGCSHPHSSAGEAVPPGRGRPWAPGGFLLRGLTQLRAMSDAMTSSTVSGSDCLTVGKGWDLPAQAPLPWICGHSWDQHIPGQSLIGHNLLRNSEAVCIHIGDSKEKEVKPRAYFQTAWTLNSPPISTHRSMGKSWKPYRLKVIEHSFWPITD